MKTDSFGCRLVFAKTKVHNKGAHNGIVVSEAGERSVSGVAH